MINTNIDVSSPMDIKKVVICDQPPYISVSICTREENGWYKTIWNVHTLPDPSLLKATEQLARAIAGDDAYIVNYSIYLKTGSF